MSLIERAVRERIVLVGVTVPPTRVEETESSLDELALLIATAGAEEGGRLMQRKDRPDPATFIGKGKIDELLEVCLDVDADTVVFRQRADARAAIQLGEAARAHGDRPYRCDPRHLRPERAHARRQGPGRARVAAVPVAAVARRGRTGALSQQAGRIGTRGPGETQLETDRRRLQRRITKLEHDLKDLSHTRVTQRKARNRSRLQSVSIVGYTNAGKSTLLNRLTEAGVLVEDRLFATLDPTTKRMQLPGGEAVLVSDTVGFVRKLPHQLVEAFKSTLEVVASTDLLIHVVDSSSPDPDGQIDAVRVVLDEIGADRVPELLVFNKADLTDEAKRLVDAHPGSVAISAETGEGVEDLLVTLGDRLRALSNIVELMIPYERGDVLAELHREGEIISEAHGDDGIRVRARLDVASAGRLAEFATSPS